MFKTEVDIESLSKKATVRWKKNTLSNTTEQVSKSENKRLHSLILTSKPENFLMVSATAPDTSLKVSKQEDLPEISAELSSLRKKHDLNRGSNFLLDSSISNLKKQLEGFRQEEIKTINRLQYLKENVNRLEESISEVTEKQEEALEATKVYNHIIERMRIHKLRLDIKNEETLKWVKAHKRNLSEEIEICRKRKESKIKTKRALESLKDYVEQETKDKELNVIAIEKDMKRRLENSNKREDRYRRQIEIAERAANEDREARATQMREDVILMRFWYRYMRKKLDYDMNRLNYIELAFEKVRKNSNVSDASEMVTKVLTTEIAYNELRKIVESSNFNIAKTHEKIQDIEENLKKVEKMKTQGNFKQSLQNEIFEKLKLDVEVKNKLIKLKEVHQKIRVWSSKIVKKLGSNEKPEDLKSSMTLILSLVRVSIVNTVNSREAGESIKNQSLQALIKNIDQKHLMKIRSDSAEYPERPEVIRELAHSTPSLDTKPKK